MNSNEIKLAEADMIRAREEKKRAFLSADPKAYKKASVEYEDAKKRLEKLKHRRNPPAWCERPEAGSCKGCINSFDPARYDGGCKLYKPLKMEYIEKRMNKGRLQNAMLKQ